MRYMKNCWSLRLTVLFCIGLLQTGIAADRYWAGPAGGAFNGASNWSASATGTPTGASVPGVSDRAIFNGAVNTSCTMTAAASVQEINLSGTYTQTVSTGNFAVTLGTGGLIITRGTFLAGTNTISLSGPFTLTSPGVFTAGNSNVIFTAATTVTGNPSFFNLTFNPPVTTITAFTIANAPTVNNVLTLSGGGID